MKLADIRALHKGKNDNFYSRIFYRKVSPFVTYVFLKLGISANAATWLSVVSALLGCFLISLSKVSYTLIGLFFIQFWYVLDHVDGEIARFTRTSSKEGLYLDVMTHNLVHPIIFFSYGLDAVNYLSVTVDFWNITFSLRRIILFLSFIAGLSVIVIDLASALRFQVLATGHAYKVKVLKEVTEVTFRLRHLHPVAKPAQNKLFKIWHILWNVLCIPGAIWFLTAGSLLKINHILLPFYSILLSILAVKAILVRMKAGIDTLY